MKIVTIIGTRPEIIRLSRILPLLDESCEHTLINTGQNFDINLNKLFFDQLKLRLPDYNFDISELKSMQQIAQILIKTEEILCKIKPDKLLLLGDTNSALSAFVAKRMGIPVYHMEAGNRCFDDRVPEEVNRRIIDHSSDILMPYTHRSKENLVREGIALNKIFVTGNPILEVLNFYKKQIDESRALSDFEVKKQQYFLVTLHRAENVDIIERLRIFLQAMEQLYKNYGYPVICSLHPRTKSKIKQYNLTYNSSAIKMTEPLGLFDFVHLEKNAFCVLTDSGTVQEECCIFNIPNVTIRDVTERPETIESGSNILSGADICAIISSVKFITGNPIKFNVPKEYLAENVSNIVTKIILGFQWSKS